MKEIPRQSQETMERLYVEPEAILAVHGLYGCLGRGQDVDAIPAFPLAYLEPSRDVTIGELEQDAQLDQRHASALTLWMHGLPHRATIEALQTLENSYPGSVASTSIIVKEALARLLKQLDPQLAFAKKEQAMRELRQAFVDDYRQKESQNAPPRTPTVRPDVLVYAERYASGMSVPEIADAEGVGRSAVWHGLKRFLDKFASEEHAAIRPPIYRSFAETWSKHNVHGGDRTVNQRERRKP